jgi:putative Mn2+ efflux pump MntP
VFIALVPDTRFRFFLILQMSPRDQSLYVAAAMTVFTLLMLLLGWLFVTTGIFRAALFLLVLACWIGAVLVSAAFPGYADTDVEAEDTSKKGV